MNCFSSAEFAFSLFVVLQVLSVIYAIRYLIVYNDAFFWKIYWFTLICTPVIGLIFYLLMSLSSRKKR
jgi:hypothetical protein